MLSTLLSVSIDFIWALVESVKLLRDLFPVMDLTVVLVPFIVSLFDNFGEKIWFKVTPWITRKSDFFQTQPFEHTCLAINSWNELSNKFPVFLLLKIINKSYQFFFDVVITFPIAIFWYYPQKNFNIFFSPVSFDPFCFDHSIE